jgi:hypothetical protein
MRANVGDRIVIASGRVETPVREGTVVEVRAADGSPPYVVRWSDGHEGLFFPGADAVVRHDAPPDSPDAPDVPASAPTQVKTWHVDLHVVEREGVTSAHAVLRGGPPDVSEAEGEARRNPRDADVPRIGDEVAVARALRRLADRLVAAAEADIRAAEGGEVRVRA